MEVIAIFLPVENEKLHDNEHPPIPVRIVNFPVGKRIVSIFRQVLGNDPHGLIFPEMVGLARRLIVVTLCVCIWRWGILGEMRSSCACMKQKILWIKKKSLKII